MYHVEVELKMASFLYFRFRKKKRTIKSKRSAFPTKDVDTTLIESKKAVGCFILIFLVADQNRET